MIYTPTTVYVLMCTVDEEGDDYNEEDSGVESGFGRDSPRPLSPPNQQKENVNRCLPWTPKVNLSVVLVVIIVIAVIFSRVKLLMSLLSLWLSFVFPLVVVIVVVFMVLGWWFSLSGFSW